MKKQAIQPAGNLGAVQPAARLVWLSAAVILPLAALAGFVPGITAPCVALIAVSIVAAVYDAAAGRERVLSIRPGTPPALRLTKDVPGSLLLTIENESKAELPIRIALNQEVKEVIVPPGRSVLDWPQIIHSRGDHIIEKAYVETASPWGLWRSRAVQPLDCTLRVYPNLRDRATAGLFFKTANVGLRIQRQVGKGREFENLRQYMPGDSFEDIHWKATAKRGHPAVKLYRVEHAQEVYAVIDASRLSAREGILESYVDAALHLALVAEKQGDRFGLVTFSNRTLRFIRARSGMDHFRLCREAIYNLHPERVSPDFREVFTSLQTNLRRRSLLAENFEGDIPLLARRHVVLVNVTRTSAMKPLFVTGPENIDDLYGGLGGQILVNRMRRLQIALQNRGVRLAVIDPARIKLEVTSQYLNVKRRQLL
jgi:uncharacterized protein (DUF58 family)